MAMETRLIDDLSRIATGAFSALSGVRDEVETRVREQVATVLARFDLVTREEFEAVKEMAAKARAEQEALLSRLEALEKSVSPVVVSTPPSPPPFDELG